MPSRVAQAQVQALAGDRVDGVRGVADEGEARRDEAVRHMKGERIGPARAGEAQGAEKIAEALGDRGEKAPIVER